jgi:hypothetical protein
MMPHHQTVLAYSRPARSRKRDLGACHCFISFFRLASPHRQLGSFRRVADGEVVSHETEAPAIRDSEIPTIFKRAALAQRAADTATEARKAECAPRGARCRDREADERAALAALNAAIAAPLPLAPAIASADPGGDAAAANLTWLTRGYLRATAADIERAWIAGRAIMPALAGLLLSMAVMTWPRRRPTYSAA